MKAKRKAPDWAAYWRRMLRPRGHYRTLPQCVPFDILFRAALRKPEMAGRIMVEQMRWSLPRAAELQDGDRVFISGVRDLDPAPQDRPLIVHRSISSSLKHHESES